MMCKWLFDFIFTNIKGGKRKLLRLCINKCMILSFFFVLIKLLSTKRPADRLYIAIETKNLLFSVFNVYNIVIKKRHKYSLLRMSR